VRTNFLIDQPVWASIQRLTARAANTTVRWASMESRLRWQTGRPGGRAWTCGRTSQHTFRLFKQVLGWTAPKIRDPAAADRWTCLILACHAQLRLARPLAADLRRPWERPAPPGRLTPPRPQGV